MTQPHQDAIRRTRVALPGDAILRGAQGDWHAPVWNLSVSGLRVARPPGFGLPVGQALEVELHCGPPEERIDLLLLARVARTDDTSLGLHFAPMPDRLERNLERALAHYGEACDPADGGLDDRAQGP
jgi:hypothetical protein